MSYEARQTVSFQLEVSADLICRMVKDDYGVPGSPVWWSEEDHDWEDEAIDIDGVTVVIKDLPIALRGAIFDSAMEAINSEEWE